MYIQTYMHSYIYTHIPCALLQDIRFLLSNLPQLEFLFVCIQLSLPSAVGCQFVYLSCPVVIPNIVSSSEEVWLV